MSVASYTFDTAQHALDFANACTNPTYAAETQIASATPTVCLVTKVTVRSPSDFASVDRLTTLASGHGGSPS